MVKLMLSSRSGIWTECLRWTLLRHSSAVHYALMFRNWTNSDLAAIVIFWVKYSSEEFARSLERPVNVTIGMKDAFEYRQIIFFWLWADRERIRIHSVTNCKVPYSSALYVGSIHIEASFIVSFNKIIAWKLVLSNFYAQFPRFQLHLVNCPHIF
jgi:hypothetical protein